ncbi:MAG: lamin tail domain-containing protein [Ferruginibacter sp.]
MKKIITLLFVLLSLQSFSQSTTLVISQVYGGGGNSGAPYNADFLELHNISAVAQSTAGLSVQYASSGNTGTWTGVFALPTASIPAGGYYLIRMSVTGATGVALPTPDAAPSAGNEIAMSATNGRVALVTGTTALSACPTASVIDLVGFGSSVCFENTATPTLSNTTAALRNNNGCTDTDNNSLDFTVGAPAPRNSASSVFVCGAASPNLSATALTAFGSVCVNTTAGPNSFTINGSALTTANVTVGALAGFTYSTTAGGTYTTTLSLTQPGGTYSQDIFVQFTPTAVQSYDGDIPVGGGGATAIDVAASGSGTIVPALSTGTATNVTQVSATLEGTIISTGCTAVTVYGIEYSTTVNFPNGSGTAVPSTNLSGGIFTSDITGLTAGTVYYYHAYATNGGGTGYGDEQSFTTSSVSVPGMVISQVYGGGGNGSATYTHDFVELFNRSAATVDISGWSVQYASSAGSSWQVATIPAATTVAAGKYFLIQLATGGANGIPLPAPDFVGPSINMSATAGKVALVNDAIALSGATACNTPTVVDVIGFGTASTSCSETAVFLTSGISNADGIFRKMDGCTDDNNNSTDFELLVVNPRNSATAANICGAASPTLSATALTAFGNVCINTTAGPNSFTITGTTLTTANVTVGALAGFTYSTTAGGTYTTTLSLTQPGGAYSQDIFVRFTPTAVQSYNGNIPVGGGGATAINVAAAGSGVNTIPTVTTGAASAITTTTATLAGTIPANGCTPVTAYGVEYSTVNGFPNGSGTPVASTNLAGINFSSNAAGLTPGTVYYYHAYATNAGGTGYGAQQTFTTVAAPVLSASALTGFGNVCVNTTAGPNSFTITGTNLTAANVTVDPLTGFTYSTTAGGTYTASLSLTQAGGAYSQQIFVQFTPTLVQSYNGNIAVGGGGATSINVAATGAGVNSVPTVTTGAASAITTTTATLAGTIPANGCTAVTAYGVEYSLVNGFPNGSGTAVPSTNLAGINFSSDLIGLTPNTTYYYHAYATNGAGTGYGVQQSFITLSLTPTLNATALAGFGNICINTTAGPNSFTVTGSALNATNITVGPLTGFTFSTTAGGTYTTSLSLAQPGGVYSQQIFVRFTPTLVQSYNGNIPVGGGGASTINVAATGAGINTIATVTSGAASAITSISATVAGTIPSIGCSAVTAYGVEYSTTNGFPNGSGTAVPATNLAGINFSANLTGLAATTTYYYHAYATNNGGTAYGTQGSFTTATPVFNTSALTGFGNVCLNTTAGPNSFTITGTNLTTANVTVAALAGYTYSTTAGGTYTASLSLTQPGGAYSQQIFVQFTPTAVQSYNGNIAVGGGGGISVNRAVTGAGINTTPSVTSGAASAVTQISATVAGTIPSIGCSAVTAYGIEYSTTNGFPNGSGTAVASTNLSGVSFSSALTGLAASTTYYYHAYATNAGGTAYGTQGSFTTAAPVLTATPLTSFGANCINTTAGPNSFVINSTAVTAANINVGPLTGYSFSTTSGGTYSASLSLTHAAGPYTQTVYVKFSPVAIQSYTGNIPVSGGGAAAITVVASGSGVNTGATVVTGTATINSPNSATLDATITNTGCSPVTGYGIEYSGISGLPNGLGTKVASSNLSSGNFSATLNGLVQGATYYYKPYAVNSGGTVYGAEQSFTMSNIPTGFVIYDVPVQRGANMHYTYRDIKPGHYEIQIFNSAGQLVFQRSVITQLNFIDDRFNLPGSLAPGVYSMHIVNPDFRDKKIFMIR